MRKERIILIICVLSIIIGCSKENPKVEYEQTFINRDYITFDSLFANTTSEQYHIFSYENYNNPNKRINLVPIPKILYKFIETNTDTIEDQYQEYYAVYKFDYKDGIKGYIYTFTSQYSPSAVGIVLYDKKTQSFLGKNELADSFGDEGWYFQKDGWLKDINGDGYLDIVNHQIDWETDLDDTTQSTEFIYNVVKDSVFAFTYNSTNKKFIESKNVNINSSELKLQKIDN